MNLFKKLVELASMRFSLLPPKQIKFDITRKDWVDFSLVLVISFLIIVYKINKI